MGRTIYCYVIIFSFFLSIHSSFANSPIFIDSIYQIGDSLADTGNSIRLPVVGPTLPPARLPYGVSSGGPTGRWSDGLLSIDFFAQFFGLPLLNPYLDGTASFQNGVNFAVAGSTALDFPFFVQRGILVPPLTVPLPNQINWFRQYLASICSSPIECSTRLQNSMVFLGEIGGDDINYPISQGRSLQEISTYIPAITQAIVNGTRGVIALGAKRIIVPGNYPIGCFPFVLILFSNSTAPNPQEFDQFGCARRYNELAIYQNAYLQNALISLRLEFPNVSIVYADYYGAFQSLLARAPILGFNTGGSLLRACCGSGGTYNFDGTIENCGKPGATVCPNPRNYINWDGLHLTQEAYRRITEYLIPLIILKLF